MKKKLYIETSVWNQLEHTDRPDWRETAVQFFETVAGSGFYEAFISAIVIDEIKATPNPTTQANLVKHINRIEPVLLPFDDDAMALTQQYISAVFGGATSRGIYNDCRHVAVATVNGIDHIISFNCKHLVNDRRIDGFNAINFRSGYDHAIDVSTPHKYIIRQNETEDEI